VKYGVVLSPYLSCKSSGFSNGGMQTHILILKSVADEKSMLCEGTMQKIIFWLIPCHSMPLGRNLE